MKHANISVARLLVVTITCCFSARGVLAQPTTAPATRPATVIDVWPDGKMPGRGATKPEEEAPDKGDHVRRITNVSKPTLSLFRAPDAKQPSPAVIVCPGGGYGILAFNKEGTEVAEWLNTIGVTAFVLKYRVPGNRDGALQDIQRAVRLVRARHAEWNIDPDRVGVMGFSAGGHLSARASTDFDRPAYPAIDEVDQQGCRPDFAVLVYPAYLDKDGQVAPELTISAKTPPTLIVHAEDDRTFVKGSKLYDAALKDAQVPSELMLFPTGGHGHGLRSNKEVGVWPARCAKWLVKIGMLPAPV